MLGVRGKVFALSFGLMLAVGIAGGLSLERELTRLEEQELERELLRHARSAREAVNLLGDNPALSVIDGLANRFGADTGARITVIAPDGQVLGDSSLSLAELDKEENHAGRPEVIAAVSGREIVVRRFSTTLDKDLLYAAVPWKTHAGVIRAAMPIDAVKDVLDRQRLLLMLAASFGLIAALLISALAAHISARVLGDLGSSASAMLGGGTTRIAISSKDELGHLAGSLNRLADERSQSVADLIKERDRLNAILQGVNEGLVALDKNLRVEVMNPTARAILAIDQATEGLKLVEIVRIPDLIDAVERGKREATTVEITIGEPTRYVLVKTAPLAATGGTVLVLHDVTDLRHMESMRRDLVANVSHELRTPVSIIRANAETLLDGALADPPQARTFVQAMLRHAERLSNLLSDLLDLARIEGGAYPLCLESLSLPAAIKRALDTLQRTAKSKNVSVKLSVDEALYARADAQALDQVLVNLLDNAIKYSFEGGAVEVTARVDEEEIRVSIIDDGPGIPERHRPRVFERFYRVDAGRSRAIGGTGLGLSIVKHLVSLMHGNVGVDPAQPRGSAFWFTLPRSQGESPTRGSNTA